MVVDTALSLREAVIAASTGDPWLFRGSSLADLAIRAVTNSPVNHVGMVVALDDLPALLSHAELGRSLPDVWTGERRRGVQLHRLGEAVETWNERYGQRTWVRQLEGPIERHHEDRLMGAIDRFDGRPFPTTLGLVWQWVTARFRRRASTLDTLYCSSRAPIRRWVCCPREDPRAGMTPGASGAAIARSSWRPSRSDPRGAVR